MDALELLCYCLLHLVHGAVVSSRGEVLGLGMLYGNAPSQAQGLHGLPIGVLIVAQPGFAIYIVFGRKPTILSNGHKHAVNVRRLLVPVHGKANDVLLAKFPTGKLVVGSFPL